ncbi:MAG: TolC family outer membrane protein [Candidatus Paracaedibacteraceae bacterium]|nr:TolC family outer membrane protein [Candidatus Paracaedibacteraceae bacterium]
MKKINLVLGLSCALSTFHAFAELNTTPQSTGVIVTAPLTEQSDVLQIAPAKAAISTLADALAAAYINNPDLQQARQELMAKHEKIAQAKAEYLPQIKSQVSIAGSKMQGSGSAKDTSTSYPSSQRTSTRSGQVTFSQNLFAGGSTAANILSVDQSIRATWADLLSKEQKVFSDVIKGYLDLISKTLKVEVHKANNAAMKKSYETAFEKHKIGEEPLTQVANAESKLAKAEADLRSAEADVIGAKASLFAIIGAEPSNNLKKPEVPENLPKTLDQTILLAIENNPDVIKAQFDHKSAQANIDKINGKYLPSLDLRAQTKRDEASQRSINATPYVTNTKLSNNSTNNQVVLEMSYDLYAGGTYSSQKREAHETAVAKRIAIEGAKTSVTGNVKSAFETYMAAKINVGNFNRQVKAAKIALESTRQEVEVGTKVLLDYLTSQSQLVEAQLNLIDSEKAYFQSAYQMLSLLGGLHAKAMKLSVQYFDPAAHYDNITVGF